MNRLFPIGIALMVAAASLNAAGISRGYTSTQIFNGNQSAGDDFFYYPPKSATTTQKKTEQKTQKAKSEILPNDFTGPSSEGKPLKLKTEPTVKVIKVPPKTNKPYEIKVQKETVQRQDINSKTKTLKQNEIFPTKIYDRADFAWTSIDRVDRDPNAKKVVDNRKINERAPTPKKRKHFLGDWP